MDAYIEFRNVVKKFDDFVALDHVSLQIPKGAFVTLLGPSGCGKTTLMRQLAGFSEPEEGDVLVDGKRMNGLPPFKRNTPLVFQEYALFPHMTVYENISYGLKLKKAPKEEKDRKVAEMLEMFNLQGLDGRFPKQLSGGQQQRVAFARALVMGQEILLLDEPFSALDYQTRLSVSADIYRIIRQEGKTALRMWTLGAKRRDIAGQIWTPSALMALAGTIIALAVSIPGMSWATDKIQALTGSDLTLTVSTGQTVALCAGALAIALAVIALVSVLTAQRGIRRIE